MARTKMGRVARDGAGLSQVQRRFLRKMVREPKALSELLREQQVCRATFAGWREEAAFERAFRGAAAGLTKDTLTDLRMSFAMCGRIISEEVLRVHLGEDSSQASDQPGGGGAEAGKDTEATKGAEARQGAGDAAQAVEKSKADAAAVEKKKGGKGEKGQRREALKVEEQRLCFEVIKVGMGAFVPKVLPRRRKRAFRRVDPVAFAELKKAQGEVRRVGVE